MPTARWPGCGGAGRCQVSGAVSHPARAPAQTGPLPVVLCGTGARDARAGLLQAVDVEPAPEQRDSGNVRVEGVLRLVAVLGDPVAGPDAHVDGRVPVPGRVDLDVALAGLVGREAGGSLVALVECLHVFAFLW